MSVMLSIVEVIVMLSPSRIFRNKNANVFVRGDTHNSYEIFLFFFFSFHSVFTYRL